jgi:hypothetical protein
MNKIKLFQKLSLCLVYIFAVSSFIVTGFSHKMAYAVDPKTEACNAIGSIDGGGACDSDSAKAKFSSIVKNIISILSVLVGAVSVIMVILGGFKYVTSNGDSNSTKSAKDTIMYALIGLLLVGFAQTIVRFVWGNT